MSTSAEFSAIADPVSVGQAPRRAVMVLAGLDIVWASWLLVCTGVGLARGATNDAVRGTAATDASFWSGGVGLLRGPIEATVTAGILFDLLLLLASVLAVAGTSARSAPRLFRVILSGTVALVLAVAALWTLSAHGLVYWGLIFG